MTAILALVADETVTSPSLWVQVGAIAGALGAVAAAGTAILKFLPGVRTVWAHHQERRKLEHAAALTAIVEPIVTRAIEPPVADLRGQVVETQNRVAISERKIRAELAAHTDAEQMFAAQLVRAVVAAGAARQADIRPHPGRAADEIPPGSC